ncbi:small ribosomal subunit protein uS11-like [Glandiceps talaboti]
MATSTVCFFQRHCRHLGRTSLWQNFRIPTAVLPQTSCSLHRHFKTTSTSSTNVNQSTPKSSIEESQVSDSVDVSDELGFGDVALLKTPIVYIKSTYNNTHINITDNESRSMVRTSCGTVGFKNSKKSSGVAAQTAAMAAATKAVDKGVNTVRVMVKGIGPGRQSSIKGLQMGGLDIVSITDNTPVPDNGCRPRKARRL